MSTLSNPEVFSLIRLCDNAVYRVGKAYVFKLVARNPLHFARIFIKQNQSLFEASYIVSQYLMTLDLIAKRQEVNNLVQ